MPNWHTLGAVSVTNGSAIVTGSGVYFMTAKIAEGWEFQVRAAGEFPYEVETVIDENTLRLTEAYAGPTQSSADYHLKPGVGITLAAEKALSAAVQSLEDVVSPGALDQTPGRVLRFGDLGGQGMAIRLTASDNLDTVVAPGTYTWASGDAPANSPVTGFGTLIVWGPNSTGIMFQDVFRSTGYRPNLRQHRRAFVDGFDVMSEWDTFFGVSNALRTDGNIPSVHLFSHGEEGDAEWDINVGGHLQLRMKVPLDVTDAGTQTFDYPAGMPAFLDGNLSISVNQSTDSAPDDSISFDKIESARAYTARAAIRLSSTEGSNPPVDERSVILTINGRIK